MGSTSHGGTPKVRQGRNLEHDIARAQDLCRDAILRLAAVNEMPNSDDWSALVGDGSKDRS